MNRQKRPIPVYLVSFILSVLSVNALAAGIMMIVEPDGSLLKMDPEWLKGSPFSNYFIPGFLLFTFIGLLSAGSAFGLYYRKECLLSRKLNILKDMQWGWTFTVYTGFATIIWITVQQALTRYFFLQTVILSFGTLILVCCLLPGMMRYYSKSI